MSTTVQAPAAIVGRTGVMTIVYAGKSHTVGLDHPNYKKIKDALVNKVYKGFEKLLDVGEALKRMSKGKCEVKNGEVYFNGEPLHNLMTARILDQMNQGFPFEPMLRFLENWMMNPSERVRNDELYKFIEHLNIPITEDGCFLAYKAVRGDYYSKTSGVLKLVEGKTDESGHIYNAPGEKIRCERSDVDDEATRTCSYGLHAGALEYSGPGGYFHNSGDKTVIVKINPADVVSVPVDYNGQKLRTCAYEVVGDFIEALGKSVYDSQGNDYVPVDDYDDDVYDDDDDSDVYEDDDYGCDDDYDDEEDDDSPSDTELENAWNDGYTAFEEGGDVSENPHPYTDELYEQWLDGYNEAVSTDNAVKRVKRQVEAKKPSGQRFHNVRDAYGRFAPKKR